MLLMLANFVVLWNVWPVTIFLSGMKSYGLIVALFAVSYTTVIIASLLLARFGLEGLLGGLLLGHGLLLLAMLAPHSCLSLSAWPCCHVNLTSCSTKPSCSRGVNQ